MAEPASKICPACGRRFAWRKKWARDWPNVRYCSARCRSRGLNEADRALERAILHLLDQRSAGASICPSEAARVVDPQRWRDLMEPARMAARRLTHRGETRITQKGRIVDPTTARGPIRIRRA